jgi:hypothetical protein
VVTRAALTITDITQADPAVVTSTAHGLLDGARIIIDGVVGMTELNGREFIVTNATTNTFEIQDVFGVDIDSTAYTAYDSAGTASEIYEIATPYSIDDVFLLKFSQSVDVMYITQKDYPAQKLSRLSDTEWSIDRATLIDGPYYPVNPTATRTESTTKVHLMTPSAATGTGVTVSVTPSRPIVEIRDNGSGLIQVRIDTFSQFLTGDLAYITGVTSAPEANGTWKVVDRPDVSGGAWIDLAGSKFENAATGEGSIAPAVFTSDHVGASIRMLEGSVWGWGTITAVASPVSATVDVATGSTFTDTTTKSNWRLGLWSDSIGPDASVFHEDRLFYLTGQRVSGSRTSDYDNFTPSAVDGTITDSHAVDYPLNARTVSDGIWIESDEKALLVGLGNEEWGIKADGPLSPTNVDAKRRTKHGSADVQPVRVGNAMIFVQTGGKKLRELAFFQESESFQAMDLSVNSSHITTGGITQLALMQKPYPVVWGVRADGTLVSLTYERDVEKVRAGWARHVLGGQSDAGGTQAAVESVAVIPSTDGTRDEVWLVVKRYVDGITTRHIEYMETFFFEDEDQHDAFFVSAGLSYDDPKAITGATQADPVVITATSHGFSNGDEVIISDVVGMTDLNGNTYVVANKTANTFELTDTDGTAFSAYVTGGYARKKVSTLTGINHLEGETLQVLGDGAPQNEVTVSGGAVTLASSAGRVHIGLGYNSDGQLLRINAGSADGTAVGKTRRIHRIGMMLHRSLGLKVGTDFDTMDEVLFPNDDIVVGQAPPLFSGIISDVFSAGYDFDNEICFRQDGPLPSTVLSVLPQMVTQDR